MQFPFYRKSQSAEAEKPADPQKLTLRPDGRIVPIKFGFFGLHGAGKSFTAAEFALALSIMLHNRAPVYVYDSEPGWQFFEQMFAIEGVELIQEPGETFDGVRAAREKAEKRGACAFLGDNFTPIWADLMKAFTGPGGYVEFNDWNELKPLWRDWTREFLNSPMHCGALARSGWNYIPEVDKRGKTKFVKTDTKFNAGGGESFGHEPHLLLEFEMLRQGTLTGRGGNYVAQATVLKDRTQVINGAQFSFAAQGKYRKGDWAAVWNALLPHIQEMQRIKQHVLIPAGSAMGSKQYSDSGYYKNRENKNIALEEIDGTLKMIFPGSGWKIERIRLQILERIFNTRAWAAVEALPLPQLIDGLRTLRTLEERMNREVPSDETALWEMVTQAKTDMATPESVGRESTLESMLRRSAEEAKARRANGVATPAHS